MLASPRVCVAASRARGTPVIGLRTQLWVCAAASRARGTPAIGLRRGSFGISALALPSSETSQQLWVLSICNFWLPDLYMAKLSKPCQGQCRFINRKRPESQWPFYQGWPA